MDRICGESTKNGMKIWRSSVFFPVHSYQIYRQTVKFSLKASFSREAELFLWFSWSPINFRALTSKKREAELPEKTRNSLKQLETSQKAVHSALCWKQTENKSEACENLFVKQRGEMPLARQSKHRNAGREIRSTIGRGEEADKAAKKAASVTKIGFRGKVRSARMFVIRSHCATKSWHTPRELWLRGTISVTQPVPLWSLPSCAEVGMRYISLTVEELPHSQWGAWVLCQPVRRVTGVTGVPRRAPDSRHARLISVCSQGDHFCEMGTFCGITYPFHRT